MTASSILKKYIVRKFGCTHGLTEFKKGFEHHSLSNGFFERVIRNSRMLKVVVKVEKLRISETTGQTRFSIVVDKECLVWAQTDIVYTWNVATLTGPIEEPGDQTA